MKKYIFIITFLFVSGFAFGQKATDKKEGTKTPKLTASAKQSGENKPNNTSPSKLTPQIKASQKVITNKKVNKPVLKTTKPKLSATGQEDAK